MDLIDGTIDQLKPVWLEESYLDPVPEGFSHCEVDQQFYCAQLVDSNRWYHIVIERVGENAYTLNRIHSFQFLGMTIQLHDFLSAQNPQREGNPNASSWEPYSDERLLIYYGQRPALTVMTYSYKEMLDSLSLFGCSFRSLSVRYVGTTDSVCQYRSNGKEVIKQLKVRIEPCQRLVFP